VVTIRGRDFGAGTLPRFVYFGAVRALMASANDTLITAYVPTGATYAPVSVTKEQRTAYSPKPFNVTFAGGNNMFSSNTFGANIDSATGIKPAGLATGDFNSDGKTDIVVANSGSSSISVYRNLSDFNPNSLCPKTELPARINPQGVAVADMDGDGKLDIAIANTGSNTISFYKNYSTANNISFRDRFDVATPNQPFAIKLANLNIDGRPDIVVVCKGGMVSTLKNISGDNFIYYGERIDSLVGNEPGRRGNCRF
jgi:hypothetical protein